MISHSELLESLNYNEKTGIFTCNNPQPRSSIKKGDVCGSTEKTGYIRIVVRGKRYSAHRLAWFYVHGVWPRDTIDHINRNKSDNRITNLRDCPYSVNQRNIGVRSNNSSGETGVYFFKRSSKWRSYIRVDGSSICLGTYKNKSQAISARDLANYLYYGD